MDQNLKTIKYKGRVVFQKLRVSSFIRLPKEYYENEACFIFVNKGKFHIRSQTQQLLLNEKTALLAKCMKRLKKQEMRTII